MNSEEVTTLQMKLIRQLHYLKIITWCRENEIMEFIYSSCDLDSIPFFYSPKPQSHEYIIFLFYLCYSQPLPFTSINIRLQCSYAHFFMCWSTPPCCLKVKTHKDPLKVIICWKRLCGKSESKEGICPLELKLNLSAVY